MKLIVLLLYGERVSVIYRPRLLALNRRRVFSVDSPKENHPDSKRDGIQKRCDVYTEKRVRRSPQQSIREQEKRPRNRTTPRS